MDAKSESAGYIRLSGEGIQDSIIDLAQASELLEGVNSSLRFYIVRESSDYAKLNYKLPIKIEEGSIWIYLLGIGGPLIYAYVKPALGQMAQNDVGKKTSSEVLGGALRKMKSTIAIAKHRQSLSKDKIEDAKFKGNLIGIPNSKGEYLYVPKDELEAYTATPPKLYEPLAKSVSSNIDLTIGVRQTDGLFGEETIDASAKPVFITDDDNVADAVIFPEMVDGMYIEIEGELSKGNERTNTMGLFYKGHTITCEPAEDNIKQHKDALFGKVIMRGRVRRHYKGRAENDEDKKPRIIFDEIVSLEGQSRSSQAKLL